LLVFVCFIVVIPQRSEGICGCCCSCRCLVVVVAIVVAVAVAVAVAIAIAVVVVVAAAVAIAVTVGVAVAVAVLVVIPEGDLLLLISPQSTCQAPKPPNPFPINDIHVAYELSTIRYTDYSS
jgi:hypothetical protein